MIHSISRQHTSVPCATTNEYNTSGNDENESAAVYLLKMTVRRLLLALDFLHAEAEVIHTGRNLLFVNDGFGTDVY